ncbi:MAG: phosphatidate cytidylyltransferase [Candidatus Hydrogenedentes bacterium]|nr:phosphatidate cytidylyltransferase [Candidatus Hydrogenedentota bacterium]
MSDVLSGLKTRLITALVLLAVVLLVVWVPWLWWGLVLFVAGVALVGIFEYFALVSTRDVFPMVRIVAAGGLMIVLAAGFGGFGVAAAALCVAVLVAVTLHARQVSSSIADTSAIVFGLVYVAWFAAHVPLMHRIPEIGPGLVTMLIVVVALTDTAAYFVGKTFGKHPLAPVISPNKSWEGAIGGFAGALLGVYLIWALREANEWSALPAWSVWRYLAMGALLSIASQAGDLVESSLKRNAGIKDSGSIFPGHGGVLDRCDGFLFAAPLLYYIADLFG